MREVEFDDLFTISEIIDKMNITLPKPEEDETYMSYGVKLGYLIVRNMYKAKDEVKKFVTDINGEEPKNIKEIIEVFKEIAKTEGLMDFLSSEVEETSTN